MTAAAQPLLILDRATIDLLDAITRTVPRLPGAACREPEARAVFDRTGARGSGVSAARREALEICSACPALERCKRWVDGMPEHARPRGIVAGQLVRSTELPLIRGRRGRPVDKAKIHELAATGMQHTAIAHQVGCSLRTVGRTLDIARRA